MTLVLTNVAHGLVGLLWIIGLRRLAGPLATAYGRLCVIMGRCAEIKAVAEVPLRCGPIENQADRMD